jgi:hypothetical protein
MLRSSSAALLATALAFTGCAQPLPPDYLRDTTYAAADRHVQGRRYEDIGEAELLAAALAVLQDLGFTLETSHTGLGFVQGVMLREAKAPEQWAVLVGIAVLAVAAAGGAGAPMPGTPPGSKPSPDTPQVDQQTISVLLSVRPAGPGETRNHVVLVSFHVELRQPLRWTAGPLRDAALYQAFFEQLSKALFLQEHRL